LRETPKTPERLKNDFRNVGECRVAAFEKNVEATIPALRRYARALTRDSEIADNLVERTLVRALRSKHLFNGGVVRDRLYAILTNLNHDRISSLARPPMLAARRQQPS
jgi:RNA polymerase sigma-70 factor, ECF subfamily